jgi:hypothetical protein
VFEEEETMKLSQRIVMLLSVGLFTWSIAAAQRVGAVPQLPTKIEGKFLIARIETENRTIVGLAHQKVGGENACAIWVTAGYGFEGDATARPPSFYLTFVRDSSDEPRYLKSEAERMLVLTIDGQALSFGAMKSVKEVTTGYSLMTQGLLVEMSVETFRKIASGSKVDVKLGPLHFSLTDQNLQDFRDLLARFKS